MTPNLSTAAVGDCHVPHSLLEWSLNLGSLRCQSAATREELPGSVRCVPSQARLSQTQRQNTNFFPDPDSQSNPIPKRVKHCARLGLKATMMDPRCDAGICCTTTWHASHSLSRIPNSQAFPTGHRRIRRRRTKPHQAMFGVVKSTRKRAGPAEAHPCCGGAPPSEVASGCISEPLSLRGTSAFGVHTRTLTGLLHHLCMTTEVLLSFTCMASCQDSYCTSWRFMFESYDTPEVKIRDSREMAQDCLFR